MTTMKKILAMLLALVMLLSLAACATPGSDSGSTTAPGGDSDSTTAPATGPKRKITVGVHWDFHYDSADSSLTDDPAYAGLEADQMRFDVVKYIEDTFNVEIEFIDLTWDGVRESLNTSVLAGTPECDLYLVDAAAGVPAVTNGLVLDLKEVLPADADVLSDHKIMNYLDIGDGKACMMYAVKAENTVADTYPLAFNKQLLDSENLEDPRELYARGEWTWGKFIEYATKLTKDTNGDGVVDQWGFDSFVDDYLPALLMSNGANIAGGTKQALDAPETIEALQFLGDIYNKYKIAAPYDFDADLHWDTHRYSYRNGNVAFWTSAAWMTGTDYDPDGTVGTTLPFDTIYVQWPVGPSGDQATNGGKLTGGGSASYFVIPKGVEDPELVYNVFEAWNNWYMGDTTIRDDPETMNWWYVCTAKEEGLQMENFNVMFDLGSRESYDLYPALGLDWWLGDIVVGNMTAAQFAETHRQQVQDKLDSLFG